VVLVVLEGEAVSIELRRVNEAVPVQEAPLFEPLVLVVEPGQDYGGAEGWVLSSVPVDWVLEAGVVR